MFGPSPHDAIEGGEEMKTLRRLWLYAMSPAPVLVCKMEGK
jgi:hypothetical protein